jgi:hypothetical protein
MSESLREQATHRAGGKSLKRKLQLCQALLGASPIASKLFIFKVNYLTWKGNPLESSAEKVRPAWIGGDVIL